MTRTPQIFLILITLLLLISRNPFEYCNNWHLAKAQVISIETERVQKYMVNQFN